MADFEPKFDQLSLITSRGNDNTLLKRALVIIHNDLITYNTRAAREYCSRNLMESLIYLTRSSNNHLVIVLSTSLLYSICSCGEVYVSAFFKLNGPIHLISMISARDNTGDEELMSHTLMIHEQAIKLFVLLTTSKKHHHDLANMTLIEKLAELCEVFQEDGCHRNCCFSNVPFDDDICEVTKEMIEGRKLVGNIDVDQSGGKGNLNMYAVDLYDTTTPVDININKELVKLGYAWPEHSTLPSENRKKSTSCDTLWSDFHVTKVVDGHCFWAFIDNGAPERIACLSTLLEEHVYSSGVCPIAEIKHGDRVCLLLAKDKNKYQWFRGCVLEVDEPAKKCHVLLLDYGYGVSVDCDQVFPLPEDVKEISHQANLCVLKGIRAAPSHAIILKYICEVITNVAQEIPKYQFQLHFLGVTKCLLKFCLLPQNEIVLKAVGALINILNNYKVRAEIGALGGCKIVHQLLEKHWDDNSMLDGLLGMLLNLIIECYPNRRILVELDCFLLLMKLYRSSTTNVNNKEVIINILKNLIGNGWRLLDPVNLPDVRGIIQERIDDMKGCFNLPNLCGEDLIEEAKRRRRRVRSRPRSCEVEPTPTYVALTREDIRKKNSPGSDSDSKSEGYKTGPDTDFEDNYEKGTIIAESSEDVYMYGSRAIVSEDEHHSFMYAETFRQIKAVDIGTTVCAMLNNGTAGTIYVGITKSSQIRGMNISRKERDNLRLGVDDLLGQFTPNVKHDKYEIKFVPVMKGMSADRLTQVEERFVIEVRVARNSYKYFQTPAKKIFFREGPANMELNIQQIRERAIQEEECKYQSEIKALRHALELTKIQVDRSPGETNNCYELDLD